MPKAISTSASSARAWRGRAASSTSARTRSASCSSAVSMANGEPKFVGRVEHRTFSGPRGLPARPAGAVRHRALRVPAARTGLELTEIAPGLDLERDVLAHMGFRPLIERAPALMDAAIFDPAAMGLRARLLMVPLADRFTFDAAQRTMFINFERLAIRTPDDVEAVRQEVERPRGAAGRAGVRGRQLRPLPPRARGGRCLGADGARAGRPALPQGHALHHQRFPARQARPGAGRTRRRAAHLRDGRRGAHRDCAARDAPGARPAYATDCRRFSRTAAPHCWDVACGSKTWSATNRPWS